MMNKTQTGKALLAFILLTFFSCLAYAAPRPGYVILKVYHYKTRQQEQVIDSFLQYHLLPSLKGAEIINTGVFKPVGNDTATDKKVFVLIPLKSLKQWEKSLSIFAEGAENVTNEKPAFSRMENIFMRSFSKHPIVTPPLLKEGKKDRIYELRSYESAGEKLNKNKVRMFNEGGEVDIFNRLGFNAIFYGEVIFGAKMPNLMYMTSFESMAARDAHWKSFSSDPEWKKLSALPEYQKNVSHIDIVFLKATDYSAL